MRNQKGLAKIIIILIGMAVLAGGFFVWQQGWIIKKESKVITVPCEARYSASIGGSNEPISGVEVTIKDIKTGITENCVTKGRETVYVELKTGETYDITASYQGVSKNKILRFEEIAKDCFHAGLGISINPSIPAIEDIDFMIACVLLPK